MSKFTDGINSISQKLRTELKKEVGTSEVNSFGAVEFAISDVPIIIEKKNSDIVLFGEDNLYPQKISELKYGSPIHNAIVGTAGDMINGDGFLLNGSKTKEESETYYNSLPSIVKSSYDLFLTNENDQITIEDIDALISFDFKEQGAFAVEVVYNTDFDRITIYFECVSTGINEYYIDSELKLYDFYGRESKEVGVLLFSRDRRKFVIVE